MANDTKKENSKEGFKCKSKSTCAIVAVVLGIAILLVGVCIGKYTGHHKGHHGGKHGEKWQKHGKKDMRGNKRNGAGMVQVLLKQADSNGDYHVTNAEFSTLFNVLDTNNDGVLGREVAMAMKAQREAMRAERMDDDDKRDDDKRAKKGKRKGKGKKGQKGMMAMDSNQDGVVDKDEFLALFSKLDVDQDGVIDNEHMQIRDWVREQR